MESSVSHDCDPQKKGIYKDHSFPGKEIGKQADAPGPRYSLVTNAISSTKMSTMTPKPNARGSGANTILYTHSAFGP